MNEAREKFRKGQRIAVSPLGEEQGIRPRSGRTGVVIGFSRDGDSVRVLWDGTNTPDCWHPDMIESTEP